MMKKSPASQLLQIVDLFEDYQTTGYRSARPPAAAGGLSIPGAGYAAGATRHTGNADHSDQTEPAPTQAASSATQREEGRAEAAAEARQGLALDIRADMSREERSAMLRQIEERVKACTRCRLHERRTHAVPGFGVLDPLVMVIGEGPGADEDEQGLPFVGRAGQYLDKWLDPIGVSRHENAYITNIVKCRPPGNRDPEADEQDACRSYLEGQIALVRPATILSVGRIASAILTGQSAGIGRIRGSVYRYDGIPLVATYHPSGVLRNQEWRRPVWEDLKLLREQFPAHLRS